MPTKLLKAFKIVILLVCLGLMVAISAYSQFDSDWAVFGGEETPRDSKALPKNTTTNEKKPGTEAATKKPLTPLVQPKPELVVEKEAVDQEEFVFPQASAGKSSSKPENQKKKNKAEPEKEADTTMLAKSSPAEPQAEEEKPTAADSRGTSIDINVQDDNNPWIPDVLENFFEKVLEKQVLVAYQIDNHLAPLIDGKSDDETWLQSPILEVPIEKGPIVKVQAVYDEKNIYFLLRWADEEANREKDLWHFDGKKWERKGEEDRLAMMWNIDNSILDFNIHACGITCHDTDKNKQLHKMYTNADVEFADLWDWGASTSNPLGFAEDRYLDNQKFESKTGQRDILSSFIGLSVSVSKGGIHQDSSPDPGSEDNTNDRNTRPIYMFDPSKAGPSESLLTNENSMLIEDYSIFKKGQIIPGHIVRPLTGSRGDIRARGRHKNGMWTLELKRALNTGNTDDVQFSLAKSYYFGIAVFNNTRQDNHKKSAKCLLRFKRKQVYSPALFFGILSVSIIFLVSLKKHEWENTDLRARGIFREERETAADSGYRDTDSDSRPPTDFDFYDDDL